MKPNNFISVKCTETSFFRSWVEFLSPYHKLSSRERDVFARILAQYCKLGENIKDKEVLKEVLWSNTSKKDMRESLGASQAYFQQVVAKLRDRGVIVDDEINPRYLPHRSEDPRLLLYVVFDWSSAEHPINVAQQD